MVVNRPEGATSQAQVLEKGKGTNEVENLWVWKEDGAYAERLEGWCELVEGSERDFRGIDVLISVFHIQACHTGKGSNPTTLFRV